MSTFERIYKTDPSREMDFEREQSTIELSDVEHLARLQPTGNYVKFNTGPKFDDSPLKVSKDMEEAGFVYKKPVEDEESINPLLKDKFRLARELTKETKVVDIRNEPPKVPMKLEMPKLEKAIKEGKNAKSKSESPKRKPKKDSKKSNAAAVESIQS